MIISMFNDLFGWTAKLDKLKNYKIKLAIILLE